MIAEQRLGGGADAQALRQLLAAADRDPCALRRKALDVILFLLQQAFGDEHGHGHVLVTVCLEHPVKLLLNIFPNGVTVRAQNEKSLYPGVIDKLRLGAYVGKPLGKILLHIGYLFNLLFLCHSLSPF